MIVSTHRSDVIAAADRCLALRDGRLAYDGAPEPAAIAEFFDPAGDKIYRHPTFFVLPDEINHM